MTLTGALIASASLQEQNDWEGDKVVLARVDEMGIWPLRDCVSAIQDIRYSPDMRTMAFVGSSTRTETLRAETRSNERYMYGIKAMHRTGRRE